MRPAEACVVHVLVLFALIACAFTLQYRLDARNILRLAEERGWGAPRVRWTFGSLTARTFLPSTGKNGE